MVAPRDRAHQFQKNPVRVDEVHNTGLVRARTGATGRNLGEEHLPRLIQHRDRPIQVCHGQRDAVDADVIDWRRIRWVVIVGNDPLNEPEAVLVGPQLSGMEITSISWIS